MTTLASMSVRLGIDTDQLRDGADRAKGILGGLGKAVAALGVGAPVVAGVATAVGGMAAAFASAGIAAKAFQLAAGPQLESVTEAAESAEAAEEAHELAVRKKAEAQALATTGGQKYKDALAAAESASTAAKDAEAAHEAQLAGMPAPTRAMAREFIGLKSDHEEWSDSLSSSTMPVFTKGLQILRNLLPQLTPFVQQASAAFGGFLDDVARGVQSANFKEWAADMSAASGTSLRDFLTSIKNLAVGFGGLLQAFTPASDNVTGGLVDMTAAFADWGTSLDGSDGFAEFLDLARDGGQTLGTLGGAVLDLAVAMGPLIGASSILIKYLAEIISSVPTPVLTTLAATLLTVRVGMKAYAAGAAVASAAQTLMASRAMVASRAWVRSAAASTAAMLRTAAVATMTALRTSAAWAAAAARATATWLVSIIRVALVTAAQFTMMAARAVVWAAIMAAQWLIAMGPIGWITLAVIALVALIIANWDTIKKWTAAIWDWVWAKIKGVAKWLLDLFMNWTIIGRVIKHWDQIKSKTQAAWNAVIDWVKGVPGRLIDLFLRWTIVGRVIKHWDQIKAGTMRVANSMVAWVRGLPGRITGALGNMGSLLYNKGMDVVRGLWRGIRAMGGWLRSTLTGWAKSLIPGPIAKALGINSPSKVLADQVGRWVPSGIAVGMTANLDEIHSAADLAAQAAMPDLPTGAIRGMSQVRAHQPRMLLEVVGADSEFVAFFKSIVRTTTGGDVIEFARS